MEGGVGGLGAHDIGVDAAVDEGAGGVVGATCTGARTGGGEGVPR